MLNMYLLVRVCDADRLLLREEGGQHVLAADR